MPITFNANTLNVVIFNADTLGTVTFNGNTVWSSTPSDTSSRFVFAIDNMDLELWLTITESAPGCVSIDWGDGTASGVEDGWANHTYSTAGEYTVRVVCAEGEQWWAYVQDAGNIDHFDPDHNNRLKSVRAGVGMSWFDASSGNASAFPGQISLTSVEMQPDYSGTISSAPFAGCTALSSLLISGLSTLSGATGLLDGLPLLTSLGPNTAGYAVRVSDGSDFAPWCRNASQLSNIVIPPVFTSISANALNGCTGITALVIPASITHINRNAFNGCSNLTSVTCLASTPPTVSNVNAFTGIGASVPFYVPAESVEAYKTASVWSSRAAYIQAIPA